MMAQRRIRRQQLRQGDISSALTDVMGRRDRALSQQGALREHEFTFEVFGPGVVRRRCVFNMAFVREPSVSYGHSIAEGDVVIGRTPNVTVSVTSWVRDGAGLYLAANIEIRANGHPRQRFIGNVIFGGLSITFPLGPSTAATTSTISFSMNDPLT